MSGKMLVLTPRGDIEVTDVNRPVTDSDLLALTDLCRSKISSRCTMLEILAGFERFQWDLAGFSRKYPDLDGKRCLAFVDEDGLQHRAHVNPAATLLWARAAVDYQDSSFRVATQRLGDFVKGTMVVLLGDDDFIAALCR